MLLRDGAQTGALENIFSNTVPSEDKLERCGMEAVLSPYGGIHKL
jgi:hypothetical protein